MLDENLGFGKELRDGGKEQKGERPTIDPDSIGV
jgi:hypothetical protein